MDSADKTVWAAVVDLETTGLHARRDVPLEVGIALINTAGDVLDETHYLIWEPENNDFMQAVGNGQAHDFVGPMHEKSGLWGDLANLDVMLKSGELEPDNFTRSGVDNLLCDFLAESNLMTGTIPMLGNSIGSLDRPFCLEHFPMFAGALSYRNIDMSTIKELCKAYNPGLYENLKPIIGTKANAEHRVMGDIYACIEELKAYTDNFFFIED